MSDPARLASLQALIGAWRTTITLLDAQGNDGEVSAATDTYRWSANEKFVLHDVEATMQDNRVQSFEVLALDPSGSGYACRSYDADGTFSDFHATLKHGRWQITGEQQRFDGHFSEDGQTLSGRWEQNSGDGWSPLMRVELRKQPQ